jgi:hypothetical protein
MVNNSTNINKTNNHLSLSHLTQQPHIMTLACDMYLYCLSFFVIVCGLFEWKRIFADFCNRLFIFVFSLEIQLSWLVGLDPINRFSSAILSWKESLNRDGQQFNQYQQNKQSPLTFTLNTTTPHHDVGLWHVQQYGGYLQY